MASRHIIQTAIILIGRIESAPTGEMLHGHASRPIRIILVPRHYPAVFGGFAKQLVMPKSNRPVLQQLTGSHQKSGIPQYVMEPGRDAPGTQCMKKHFRRIGGFIGGKFIEQRIPRMLRIGQLRQLVFQLFDLLLIQHLDPGYITQFLILLQLLVCQPVFVPIAPVFRPREQAADQAMYLAKVLYCHSSCFYYFRMPSNPFSDPSIDCVTLNPRMRAISGYTFTFSKAGIVIPWRKAGPQA